MGLSSLSSRAIKARLWQLLTQPTNDWAAMIAGAVLPTDQASETYAGLGNVPALTAWDNGTQRHTQNLRSISFAITNAAYQTGLRVNVDDVRRNKVGQVEQRIADLVARYNQHWMKLLSSLIEGSTNCYDGTTFFSSSHSEAASGTQNNTVSQVAATNTDPTAAEMEASILNAIEALYGFKDDQGEPINEDKKSFIVMVPPIFMSALSGALGASLLDTGAGSRSNIIATLGGFQITPVVNQRLTGTDKAYVFCQDGRSFIRQQETGPEISAKAEGSEFEHDYRQHEYGVATVRAAGYGNWQSAVKITYT